MLSVIFLPFLTLNSTIEVFQNQILYELLLPWIQNNSIDVFLYQKILDKPSFWYNLLHLF